MAAVQPGRTATQQPSGAAAAHERRRVRFAEEVSSRPIIALRPLIASILRSRYCVPGSVFLVEDVQTALVPGSSRWQVLQLLLGDGRLCIQALLAAELHGLVQRGEVTAGTYVQLDEFSLGWERLDGNDAGEDFKDSEPEDDGVGQLRGRMVYLMVEGITVVGRDDAYLARWRRKVRRLQSRKRSGATPATATKDATKPKTEASQRPLGPRPSSQGPMPSSSKDTTVEKAFDNFDTLTYPLKISPRKSQKLPEPPRTVEPGAHETPTPTTLDQAAPPFSSTSSSSSPSKQTPVSLPRDWHNLQSPLRLTTLHAIPHLPYAQGWSCNVLAIVISVSALEPSYLPPHRQRTARLADPSTAKQVHLTVFLDPENFEPKVGSAVLLVGVKNHPFDGGSLKKYASDGAAGAVGKGGTPATGASWWFEDPWELGWCDVAGIKEWWAGVEGAT